MLEIGCGTGRDSAVLDSAGFKVIALDRSAEAIGQAKARVPGAGFHCQDIRDSFPVAPASVGAVVASLSLHYFPWAETVALLQRVRACLSPGGVLLCRLNSTNDHHYGASGHPPLDDNYYLVDGEPKRFFDEAAVRRLFAEGWSVIGCEERVVDRYEHPKALWEVVATASAASGSHQ